MTQKEHELGFERMRWHLNVSELAQWFGVSRDTLHSRGLLANPDAEIGRERLFDVRRLMREQLRSEVGLDDDGQAIDIEHEKRLKLRAERIGQELKNAEALNELAPQDLMMTTLADALAMMCSWLESVPSKIKRAHPDIAGITLDAIQREMATVQNAVADCRINFTDHRMAPLSDADAIDASKWRAEIGTRTS